METAWRFRIMLFMAFTMILFGDMLGYGNVNNSKNKNSITNSNKNNAVNAKDQAVETTLKANRHKIDGKFFAKDSKWFFEMKIFSCFCTFRTFFFSVLSTF